MTDDDMTDADLLRRAIAASGMSARSFAERVLVRDERTVRRWTAGASPMPEVVRAKLRELVRDAGPDDDDDAH